MPQTTCHKLLDDPPVYHIWSYFWEAAIRLCAEESRDRACYILMSMSWHVPEMLDEIRGAHEYAAIHCPQASFMVLCPTIEDVVLLKKLGFEALHVQPDAFLDERLFYPRSRTRKLYSAVYNGAAAKFKRHWLAWTVANIAVITRFSHDDEDRDTQRGYIEGYRSLAYCNLSADGLHYLSTSEVAEILFQSHCGLILSETEGSCFASAEYLLSGIPVVSTPSQGGRDQLFDRSCVWIVPPEQKAVKEAVEAAMEAHLNPLDIRQATMELIRPHRLRLISYLSDLSGRDLFEEATEDGWLPSFVHKLENFRYVDE